MPDEVYPGRLVPKTNYLALDCEPFVSEGYILRCLKKPAEFDPAGMITEKCFTFPQKAHWITHFSVSLLGNYQPTDSAWQFALHPDGPRYREFDLEWNPGRAGLKPTNTEATIPAEWGYFYMPINQLHGASFSVGAETYTCYIVHQPTNRNYWHFELRFTDKEGNDLKDLYKAKALTEGKIRGIVTGIRAKISTEVSAKDISFQHWNEKLYCKKWWHKIWSFVCPKKH